MNRHPRTRSWLRPAAMAAAAWCGTAWLAPSVAGPAPVAEPANTATTAQAESAHSPWSLRQAFDAAWARQPEAVTLPLRRDAVTAQQQAAASWTPQAAALELSNKTDRLNRNQGARELEVGVAVPLWLPGERSRSASLAQAEAAALDSRTAAAQLRVAASVREAWWQWERARLDADALRDQLASAQSLADDVARRTSAGDLARADQHQADGAVASAQAAVAQAEASLAAAAQHLRALTGTAAAPSAASAPTAEPEPASDPSLATAEHATLQELKDRAAVAERTAALTATQSRANPELVLATTRDRGAYGEASQQSITLALRIPLGDGPRHDARRAQARADAAEAQAQLQLERDRLRAEHEAVRLRVDASRHQLAAAERRAQLARESRGFFDKSFRLGETDLPTRLRIEADAADAERQAARARIELAAAISAWRQALGLLPQ